MIISGRVAITHPKQRLLDLKSGDPKVFRESVELMTAKDMVNMIRRKTFITSQNTKGPKGFDKELDRELQKNKRLEDAKTKNKTFQLFDKMLGIEKNPKLHKIREANPLNNIAIPSGDLTDLDERISLF